MPNDPSIENILADLAVLQIEFQKIQSHCDDSLRAHGSGNFDEDSLSAASEAWQSSTEPNNTHSLHQRLNGVCSFYLDSDNAIRQRIRDTVAAQRSILDALHEHPGWCAKQLKSTANRDYLRTGLAAIAIHDNRIDFRDTFTALADLYLASIETGIQPSLDLYKVGALASDLSRTKWPQDSTKNFLQHFEDSAYFMSEVQPRLNPK